METSDSVGEDWGAYTFTVTRSTAGPAASVNYTLTGSATAGADYTGAVSGTLNWGVSDGADKTFVVNITDDLLDEPNETIVATLSNEIGEVLGPNNQIVVTIIDNDTQNLSQVSNLSNNQQATATVIDNACIAFDSTPPVSSVEQDFKTLCDRVRSSSNSDTEVKAALDAINPEGLTKMGFFSRQLGSLQQQNIGRRFDVIHRGGGGGIDLSGLNLNVDGQEIAGVALASLLENYSAGAANGEESSRWGIFASGNLSFGDRETSAADAGYDFDLYALTVGIDYRYNDDLVLGTSIGYGAADIDYSNGAGSMDTASWSGTVYASYYLRENWYLDGLINYAQDDYDSTRRILYTDAGGTIDRTARGSSNGNQWSIGVSSGYDYHVDAWAFGPHFSSHYSRVSLGRMEESGAEAWNAIVSSSKSESFTMSGGAHASYTFKSDWGHISPYARFDQVHEFKDDADRLQMRFAVSSELIEISTDRADSDYTNLGVGVTAQFKHGISGFVDYQTTTGYSGFDIDGVSIGMNMETSF